MRRVITLLFVVSIGVAGCVDEPQCPEEDDAICSCDDGSQGELECSDGEATCICDSEGDDE